MIQTSGEVPRDTDWWGRPTLNVSSTIPNEYPGLQINIRGDKQPTEFPSPCFLTVDTMWAAASHDCKHAFPHYDGLDPQTVGQNKPFVFKLALCLLHHNHRKRTQTLSNRITLAIKSLPQLFWDTETMAWSFPTPMKQETLSLLNKQLWTASPWGQ